MQIDFVSDIACPWCAVGLNALERALERVQAAGAPLDIRLAFQPFELNPDMPPEGADTVAYLSAKYGIDAEQIAANQAAIRARGAEVGFAFGARPRVWNTFDAHRLIAFASTSGECEPRALKHALLRAYHGEGRNPSAREVLLDAAAQAGLDAAAAARVIDDPQAFAAEVREREAFWQNAGIRSVPAVVINRRHLISGGQPVEVFERALRQLAAEGSAAP